MHHHSPWLCQFLYRKPEKQLAGTTWSLSRCYTLKECSQFRWPIFKLLDKTLFIAEDCVKSYYLRLERLRMLTGEVSGIKWGAVRLWSSPAAVENLQLLIPRIRNWTAEAEAELQYPEISVCGTGLPLLCLRVDRYNIHTTTPPGITLVTQDFAVNEI